MCDDDVPPMILVLHMLHMCPNKSGCSLLHPDATTPTLMSLDVVILSCLHFGWHGSKMVFGSAESGMMSLHLAIILSQSSQF
jgi:hypothetical protein